MVQQAQPCSTRPTTRTKQQHGREPDDADHRLPRLTFVALKAGALLARADAALYEAKRVGRNHVVLAREYLV